MELKGVKAAKDFEGKYCEEENDKLKVKRIPRSTKYRLLKRLAEMGYLEQLEGVDKRYRYYKLSSKGEAFKGRLLKSILKELLEASNLSPYERQLLELTKLSKQIEVPFRDFKRISCSYGIPPKLLLETLDTRVAEKLGNKVVVIKL